MSQANNNHRKNSVARLLGNLKQRVIGDTTPQASLEQSHQASVRFESLEPRVLLAGDSAGIVAVAGSIDVQGEQDRYEFTLDQRSQVVFDSLTNNSSLNWSLAGPQGTVITNRSFFSSDSVNFSGNPLLDLAVGDYVLTVDGANDAVGAYSFKLIDVAQAAQVLTVGSVVNGTLSPAKETDIYRFNAVAGEQYYFDQRSNAESIYWRLLDPYGRVVFGPSGFSDQGVLTLGFTGTYTLLVEGHVGNTNNNANYSFNVQPVVDEAVQEVALGNAIAGDISTVGQRDFYRFSLTEARSVYFDSLTNSSLNWSLVGPQGSVITNRSFSSSDSANLSGNPLLDLAVGDYVLTVDGVNDVVGAYSFKLLDVAQAAQSLTVGTVVNGTLSPAKETDIYRFNAVAGEQYYFDQRSSAESIYWRLLDPYGRVVFGPSGFSDQGVLTLGFTGTYTLLVEGYIGNTNNNANYSFNVENRGSTTPPVMPVGSPLVLGSTISGSATTTTQQAIYNFSLTALSALYLDVLSFNSFTWSLVGPRGSVISNRHFQSSDANGFAGNPLLSLVAGDYVLTVTGSTGAYSFKLVDVEQAAQVLTVGTVVNGTLSPAKETDIYQFNAVAGEQYYFDHRSNAETMYWRLLDPYGRVVFGPSGFSDQGVLTLGFTGAYTLLVEGYSNNSNNNANYSFNVQPVVDEAVQEVALNSVIAGDISTVGQRDFYRFSLTEARSVYFDSFTNHGSLDWSLVGPQGTVITNRSFFTSDSAYFSGNPLLDLAVGDYVLTVDGVSDVVGAYSFKLVDVAQAAQVLTVGSVVNGTLSPAKETDIYRFNAVAGEQYYFDHRSNTETMYWRLLDPYGRVVFGPSGFSDQGVLTLGFTGTYTLLVEGHVGNTNNNANYSFNVQPVVDEAVQEVALGNVVTGDISTVGQRDFYRFSLAEARSVYFDSLTNNSNINWSLVGPQGSVITNRSFFSSDSANLSSNPLLDLAVGDYVLTVDGVNDVVGAYSFKLLDVEQAVQSLTVGIVVNGTLSSAKETDIYRFNAVAGEQYYFDQRSNAESIYWRLLDPYGRVVFGSWMGDQGVLTLGFTGTYTLLVEGHVGNTNNNANYSFNVQPVVDEAVQEVALDNVIAGDISTVGQRDFYRFSLTEARSVYFDSLTNNSNINWSLVGPQGSVITNRSFFSSDSANLSSNPLLDLAVGDYVLTVDGVNDVVGAYSFKLVDVAQAAQVLTVGSVVNGTLSPAKETDIYRFNAVAGEQYYFDQRSSAESIYWRLLDPYGRVVFGPSGFSDQGVLTLGFTGTYTLLVEGYVGNTNNNANYSFNVEYRGSTTPPVMPVGSPLVLGSTISGSATTTTQQAIYNFSLTALSALYFDTLSSTSFTWSLAGPRGSVISNRNFQSSDANGFAGNSLLSLVAGDYVLTVTGSTGAYSFKLLDVAQAAQSLTVGTVVNGTLSPAKETDIYQFNAVAGEQYYFDHRSNAENIYWRLLDPYGRVVFGSWMGDQGVLTLGFTGTYTLLVEGYTYNSNNNAAYSFNVQPVVDEAVQEVALNSVVTGDISTVGQRDFYRFSLTEARSVYFDSFTNSSLDWSLAGPQGTVITNRSFFTSDSVYFSGNPLLDLAVGDYVLTVDGVNDVVGAYSFKLVDVAQAAQVLTVGTVVNGTLSPAKETDIYRFNAVAGEQYYFDHRSNAENIYWRLLDPYGRVVFSSWMGDQGVLTLGFTGTYTLLVEGHVGNTNNNANYSFNVQPTPQSAAIVINGLGTEPSADLVIRNLIVTPVEGVTGSGKQIKVSWDTLNIGSLTTETSWQDRILVRNLDVSNTIILNYLVDYIGAASAPLAANEQRHHDIILRLPEGNLGAGRLEIQILADVANTVNEKGVLGEQNNIATMSLQSELGLYADLQVSQLTLEPAANWQADESVTLHWRVNNTGTAAVSSLWEDQVFIRNLTTGQIIRDVKLSYDSISQGPLAAGSFIDRAMTFNWPMGVSSVGRFEFIVTADGSQHIFENNLANTAEANNSLRVTQVVGPDLEIANLSLNQTTAKAGDTLNLSWTTQNSGVSPVLSDFNERIVVTNKTTQEKLLDTVLVYSVQQSGVIASSESRARYFNFRLPDGIRGVGDIEIVVTTDKNSNGQGQLFETNTNNNAELNNASSTHIVTDNKAYADLHVALLSAPDAVLAAQLTTITWQVTNQGQADAVGAWNDQIILSTDNQLGNSDDVVLATVRHEQGLAIGESYQQHASVVIPLVATGNYRLFVKTDSGQELIEPDTRADNVSAAHSLSITLPYTDLYIRDVTIPTQAMSGDNLLVSWQVENIGTATTDVSQWSDRVILSRDTTVSADDIVLSGAVSHTGLLAPNETYNAQATLSLPRDISGTYYVIVQTNVFRQVNEQSHTSNNSTSSVQTLQISLSPVADLHITTLETPTLLRPNQAASISYSLNNQGQAATNQAWRDRLYLENSQGQRFELATRIHTQAIASDTTQAFSLDFVLPSNVTEGEYQWVLVTDSDNSIYERDQENNNTRYGTNPLAVRKVDLQVTAIQADSLVVSGQPLVVSWTVRNTGADTEAAWTDSVYLIQQGTSYKVADVQHNGGLLNGASYSQQSTFTVPLNFSGEYELVVITDSQTRLDESQRLNNRLSDTIDVDLAPYADLVVSDVQAPTQLIADPALLNVAWTVTNQGTGAGQQGTWTDRIILSQDSVLGNGDDRIVGEFIHQGGLTADASYQRQESIYLPALLSGRFKLFVVTDAKAQAFENQLEANNVVVRDLDVMTQPYADLQVESLSVQGQAQSGKPLVVTWRVANLGIGISNLTDWQDRLWLSTNPDGTGQQILLANSTHLGALVANDAYTNQLSVMIPNGLEGQYYLNLKTGAGGI